MKFKWISPMGIFYFKIFILLGSILILLINGEQQYSNLLLVSVALVGGFLLGKLTCGTNFKTLGLGVTISIFILMNLLHSFLDGITFGTHPFYIWISAISGHELIRQPTLYILFWAILDPMKSNRYKKVVYSIFCVTIIWLIGIWLGKYISHSFRSFYLASNLLGYSIFLFFGDIFHHIQDEYKTLKKMKLQVN